MLPLFAVMPVMFPAVNGLAKLSVAPVRRAAALKVTLLFSATVKLIGLDVITSCTGVILICNA